MSLRDIRTHRTDMSDYLLHWTTRANFWRIVQSGFLIAGKARRKVGENRNSDGEWCATIRDARGAVCFSEMPIGNYLQSTISDWRYERCRWGIAIPKNRLYDYGCRPVISGDEALLDRLKDEDRYLWCHFDPGKESDWTHEREWRTLPNTEANNAIGLHKEVQLEHEYQTGGLTLKTVTGECLVPLHVPDRNGITWQLPKEPKFVLVVQMESDVCELWEKVKSLQTPAPPAEAWVKPYGAIAEYRDQYLLALEAERVVSFERARDEQVSHGSWRLEDLLSTKGQHQDDIARLWEQATTAARREALDCIYMPGDDPIDKYEFYTWSQLERRGEDSAFGAEQRGNFQQRIIKDPLVVNILRSNALR